MRLIDADKLKWCKILKPCMNDMISACIKEIDIKDIPTADAVPMAPVKIERYDNGQGRCPLCKTDIPFQVVNDKWAFEPYCPHCGVKMNLEDDAK